MNSLDYVTTTMIPTSLVIIEPTNFKINPETIKDNQYMSNLSNISYEAIHNQVLSEHKNYQKKLAENKVNFKVHKQIHPEAYDSIFACDWFGTIKNEDFPDGILIVFPVKWPTRRLEKNYELVNELKKSYGIFEDLSFFEQKDLALESFGTMSHDFHNRVVYLNLSERCHFEPANYFVELLNKHSVKGKYKLRIIESADPKDGIPCFHTGLYLAFVDKVVFFCKEFVKDALEAEKLVEEFSGKYPYKYEVVLLSYEETLKMCANVLEVNLPGKEKTGLVMSRFSANAYSEENLMRLKEKYELIVVEMDTINTCAGGSLRCMTSMLF
jgi:hypothetical protein